MPVFTDLMEEWKDVAGYEGTYQVSNTGKVKRLSLSTVMRNQHASWEQDLPENEFKLNPNTSGYFQVALTVGNEKKTLLVHRLVAMHFLEKPSRELIEECTSAGLSFVPVNHIDSNRKNNLVSNLEWCSPKYNVDHCKNGVRTRYDKISGSKHVKSLLNESEVNEIIKLLKEKNLSQTDIAERFNVKQITISNIWTGRSWSWFTGIKYKPSSVAKRACQPLQEQVLTRGENIEKK